MEEQLQPAVIVAEGLDEFARELQLQRRRVQDFLATQRRQFADLETRLDEQLERLASVLDDHAAEPAAAPLDPQRALADPARALAEWTAKTQALENLRSDLERWRAWFEDARDQSRREQRETIAEVESHLARLTQQQEQGAAQAAAARQERQQLAAAREQLADDTAEQARTRERLAARMTDLDRAEQNLADARLRLNHQHRRLAQEFRQRRADALADLERRRAEAERLAEAGRHDAGRALADARSRQGQLEQQIDERTRECEARIAELAEARRAQSGLKAELAEAEARQIEMTEAQRRLDEQLARGKTQLAEACAQAVEREEREAQAESQLARLKTQLAEARQGRAEAEAQSLELAARLEHAGSQFAQLRNEQAKREEELAHPASSGDAGHGGPQGTADLARRLEMALDDLRGEKAKNVDLQKKLAQAPAATGAGTIAGGASFDGNDWESQKHRMLASLEADGDDGAPERVAERLKIEQAIRATEQVVSEKDREIAELQQMLEQQSANLGSHNLAEAATAAANAEVLDNDQLVLRERQNLEQLQAEWREKLRMAEVDISVQRAKIGRERAELEEKLRQYEAELATRGDTEAGNGKNRGKGNRRWLSRLGLSEQGEEEIGK